jgi:outer membrane protein assembly factor BamB
VPRHPAGEEIGQVTEPTTKGAEAVGDGWGGMRDRLAVIGLVWAAVVLVVAGVAIGRPDRPATSSTAAPATPATPGPTTASSPVPSPVASPSPSPTPTPTPSPSPPPDLRGGVNAPWGEVEGLTMFRGNPTRTWYGTGPIPDELEVQWTFPDEPMCGNSPVAGEDKVWCGTGWTGQPLVWERPDGVTEVIVGAYDKAIHFLDAATGERTRPDVDMGDIIKGTVTLDPDGHPLLYAGSRDDEWRIIALDREEPEVLWSLAADAVPGMWNNDWDSNPVVIDDVVYVGGENSWWFAIELGRGVDEEGLVTVDPEIVFDMPAFTDELVARVGRQQSVENSTAVFEDRAYFANSAGRVVGVDIGDLPDGDAEVVLDFWMGDDVDASIVADPDGDIYVSAQVDLDTERGEEVGQLVRLDPDQPDDPVVWSLDVPPSDGFDGGIWATPAWRDGLLYVPTQPGELLVVDAADGEVVWSDDVGGWAQSSPVLVGDRLLLAVDCFETPALRVYDLTDPRRPERLSDSVVTQGCIESTPAAWDGQVFVGSRDGYLYALGPADDDEETSTGPPDEVADDTTPDEDALDASTPDAG